MIAGTANPFDRRICRAPMRAYTNLDVYRQIMADMKRPSRRRGEFEAVYYATMDAAPDPMPHSGHVWAAGRTGFEPWNGRLVPNSRFVPVWDRDAQSKGAKCFLDSRDPVIWLPFLYTNCQQLNKMTRTHSQCIR